MEIIGILFKFYVKDCKKLGIFEHYFIEKVVYYSNFMPKNVKNWVILNIIFHFYRKVR